MDTKQQPPGKMIEDIIVNWKVTSYASECLYSYSEKCNLTGKTCCFNHCPKRKGDSFEETDLQRR